MKLSTAFIAAASASLSKQAMAAEEPEPPVDYGDLIQLNRDTQGVPILAPFDQYEAGMCDETSDEGCCLWPKAFTNSDSCPLYIDEDNSILNPCLETFNGVLVIAQAMIDTQKLNAEAGKCAVLNPDPDYPCANCIQETEFGRTSVTRSPLVLDMAYTEVINNLMLNQCSDIQQDASGRFIYYAGGQPYTIDSPLQNLAIYRELIKDGQLKIDDSQDVPLPEDRDPLELAAIALGAAVDKGGQVTDDLIAYTNRILGFPEAAADWDGLGDQICIWVRSEELGVTEARKQCFLNFLPTSEYNRSLHFQGLPQPPYIPEGAPEESPTWFEYLEWDGVNITDPRFKITQGPIMNAVGVDKLEFNGDEHAESFAALVQIADDARALINFMHNWPLPSIHATDPSCGTLPEYPEKFNVEITQLLVPVMISKKGDGVREFTVTVSNMLGGAKAMGLRLNITAPSLDLNIEDDAEDAFLYPFDLDPGDSLSVSGQLLLDAGSVAAGDIIEWTATIECNDDLDCNLVSDLNTNDNSMTAETQVVNPGGGGGGGGGGGRPGSRNMLRGL